ncbi:MAG TPA: hypothetical protein VEC14_17440 [Reyranellaceae bacterium]|nr:hypothetical protein [Reyranellaceae bacterium]
MTKRWIALLLLLAVGPLATASAQITIGPGGIQIGPGQQQQHFGPGVIYVTAATYGANCGARRGNMTSELADTCGGRDYCVYRVNPRIIGDPAVGCGKDFHVSYTCRQGQQERWASAQPEASGQSVVLDCRR